MLDPAVLPSFLLAVTVILVAPGPDMAFMLASGLEGGHGAAVRAACGITAGVSIYVVVSALGVAATLVASPGTMTAVQLAGAAYLAHLGLRTWREASDPWESVATASPARYFGRGLVVNLTNPKIVLFFAAFLPRFVDVDRGSVWLQLLLLGLILQVAGFLVDLAVGLGAGTVRRSVVTRPRLLSALSRAAAAVYLGIALLVVVEVTADGLAGS